MASSIHLVCAMTLVTFGCVDSPEQELPLAQTASMVQEGTPSVEPPAGLAATESDGTSNDSAVDDNVVDPAGIALEDPPIKEPGRPGIVADPAGVAMGDPPPHQPTRPGIVATGDRRLGAAPVVVDPTVIALEDPPVKEPGRPGVVAGR
jgi:hypothetical protein